MKYQTRKDYCTCCSQKLPEPKVSEMREFEFSKDTCLEWLVQEGWEVEAECDVEFESIIREFVYETIHFFATGSDEKILIDNGEFEKVKQLILKEVVGV